MHNSNSSTTRRRLLAGALVFLLPMGLLLGGCSPTVTAPDSKDVQVEKEQKKLDPTGWNTILDAVKASQGIQKYGIRASITTKEQNRYHDTSIYGHINLPNSVEMSQNLDGRSYYLYQNDTMSYYRQEGVWKQIARINLPDTFSSLQRLDTIKPAQVYRYEDQSLLTHDDTEVYEFEADAISLSGLSMPEGKSIPSRYTLYIDKSKRYIRGIDIVSTSAIDDIGTVISNAKILFFDIGTAKVEIPEALKKQLKNK